jgi:hypothetical protein
MGHISGVKYHKTVNGKIKSVTINLTKWGEYLEDFLDMIEVKRIKNSPDGKVFYDLSEVKKKLKGK